MLDEFLEPKITKEQRQGYYLAKRIPVGRTVVTTIHWSAKLGLAPLEIRHKIGRVTTGRFERRIVVQLPAEMPVLQGGAKATPVVYAERRDKEISGWVQYLGQAQIKTVGTSARVSQGVLQPAATKKGASSDAVTPQTIVATRKQIDATLNPEDVLGDIGQCQQLLGHNI